MTPSDREDDEEEDEKRKRPKKTREEEKTRKPELKESRSEKSKKDRSAELKRRVQEDDDEDDDDDDDEDDDDPTDDVDYDDELAEKFFFVGGKNHLQYFWTQAVGVLTKPKAFFAAMPADGTKDAFMFLLIAAVAYSTAQGIAKANVEAFILPFMSTLFFTSMGSYFVFFVLGTMCKGKGTLVQTFRVLAYSKATLLFAWVALGSFPIGGILMTWIYCTYLNVVGLTKVHKLPRRIVIAVVIFFTLGLLLFKKMTGL